MSGLNSHEDVKDEAIAGAGANPDVADNTTHRNTTTGNPHSVSKGEVGLGNADNTSDANKPISTAAQTALDAKEPTITPKNSAFNKNFGSGSGTVCQGNDARLSDSRTPTAHALAGAEHSADSLGDLNSKINDLIATYGGLRDIGVGTLAQRPAAGTANRLFWTTDEGKLYRDNGSSWDALVTGGFIPLYGESEGESINSTPDTWSQKLRVSITPSVSAEYRISWYCELRPNNSGEAVQVRLELDDTTIIGQGNVVHPYPADRYEMQSGFKIMTLSAAAHTIDLDWRSEWDYAADAYIRRARIEITQVPE